jgi:hypothetical protein
MPGEPEYIATEDDFSGRHGDVREDFRAAVAGVPAVRGFWCCPLCKMQFSRRKPCVAHISRCKERIQKEASDAV